MARKANRRRKAIRATGTCSAQPFELGNQVEFELTAIAQAGDDGDGPPQPPRFRMHAYTGGRLNLKNFAYPVVVDLAGLDVGKQQKPVLRDHRMSAIIGHSTAVEITANGLHVEGVISGANDTAREVVESARAGFPWEASIGARPEKMAFLDSGERATVNGKQFTGPLYVARRARLGEISFVALGADEDGATARVAASSKESTMGFEGWCEEHGIDITAMDESQIANLRSIYERETARTEETVQAAAGRGQDAEAAAIAAVGAELREAAAAETERIHAIGSLCGNEHPEIQARAIRQKWSAERTELEILRSLQERSVGQAINAHVGGELDANVEARAIEASLLGSLGFGEAEVKALGFSDQEIEAALSSRFRGAGIRTVMYACLNRAGKYARPDRVDNEVIRAAFEADRLLIQAAGGGGGFSSVSLSGIMSNLANKLLMAGYNSVASVVPDICAETDTNDFKEFTRYRLNGTGVLERLGPTGEIEHTQISDQSFSNKLKTYASMLALSREMMINDDLGAFSEIPRIFGRMSAMTREEVVFTLLLSNPGNFFHADNDNLITDVLGIDGLTAALQVFRDQTAPDGRPILVNPRKLLVPTSLEILAKSLNVETRIIQGDQDTSATAGTFRTADNPHAGQFTPVTSPFLNSQGLTGSSGTAWYMLADPMDLDFIQVAYLRGQRSPVLESAQADFNTLGMQWRNYYDFGVAMSDPRAAVKSTGAG